ncbi:hypothetical protein [Planktothrix sp. FACHB-1365]|uniref:hypothetical protein n=1 Tax=Planktothrix sp. FACHB-1365 TaxID=2692855 RepID=UPI001688709E|nr:hypothetical protein [Planktothrix sp. FACHB-1365]MBD2485397.1 hypothetical protein [Planktothrix sp. FACHB-1365]
MEIHKQFSFVGNLKKLHEDDNQPIENFSAGIQCHRNGNIFLEIDSRVHEKLNHKKFYESTPIYKFTNPPKFTEDERRDPSFLLQLKELEQELVQKPYKGNYIIEGKTLEGWVVIAEIADYNYTYTLSFGEKVYPEVEYISKKHLIKLNNLSIDYNPEYTESKKLEIVYGLANLKLTQNLPTQILDSKYELSLVSLTSGDQKNYDALSAEMVLRSIDKNDTEVNHYKIYSAWLELLISFATGKCLKEIYKIETSQSNDSQKKVEYWSGNQLFKEGRGIAVVQQAHLTLFIQQCASKVTWENFSDKGLGSALGWYTDAFSSNTVSVEFILFCTVLETLTAHHSSETSSKLIPTAIYRKIRNDVLKILQKYECEINNHENDLQKYKSFQAKLEKSFSDFNKLGSLRTSLKQMLEFYKTPYKDLFPELEFIKIRDDIVHRGFGGDNILSDLRKLGNLVVRLVLSILQYQGNYIESTKSDITSLVDFEKYCLSYQKFPFDNEH